MILQFTLWEFKWSSSSPLILTNDTFSPSTLGAVDIIFTKALDLVRDQIIVAINDVIMVSI